MYFCKKINIENYIFDPNLIIYYSFYALSLVCLSLSVCLFFCLCLSVSVPPLSLSLSLHSSVCSISLSLSVYLSPTTPPIQKVALKDFSSEVRASRDVESSLRNMSVMLHGHSQHTLTQLVDDCLGEMLGDDRRAYSQARAGLFTHDRGVD